MHDALQGLGIPPPVSSNLPEPEFVGNEDGEDDEDEGVQQIDENGILSRMRENLLDSSYEDLHVVPSVEGDNNSNQCVVAEEVQFTVDKDHDQTSRIEVLNDSSADEDNGMYQFITYIMFLLPFKIT